jgi:hypothetical protein
LDPDGDLVSCNHSWGTLLMNPISSNQVPLLMILLSLGFASSSIYSRDRLLRVLLWPWWLEVHTGSTKWVQHVPRDRALRFTYEDREAL